jgi:hypothetical protein
VLSHCALFMNPSDRPADGPTAHHAELLDRHGFSPRGSTAVRPVGAGKTPIPTRRRGPRASDGSGRVDEGGLSVLPLNLCRGAT